MTIAVNTHYPAGNITAGSAGFIVDCISRLAKKHPQHNFIYFFDRPVDTTLITASNIEIVVAGPETKSTLLRQYWYDYKLPSLLRKYKADMLLCAGGSCSLRTKVPQCLLLQDMSFLQYPQYFTKSQLRFYKRLTPKFMAKAKTLSSFSALAKCTLAKQYKFDEEKIDAVNLAINTIYQPLGEEQKEQVKAKYTAGKEYFLCTGELSPRYNLLNLLKAFSFFKKRQKSNMQLVIATGKGENDNEFIQALKTFKFRNEVILPDELPESELAAITAAAYAFVYPVLFEDLSLKPLEAMQCEVPVICSNRGTLPETCGEAALYANPDDFNDIAEKMMLLFKDENRRREIIKTGLAQAGLYTWDKATQGLWQTIVKTSN